VSKRARLAIRRYGGHFVTLLFLMAVGTACGLFILVNQRLPNPFASYYAVNAAFPTAAGVEPGLGEPVNVAGVRVGQITGVSLRGGQAIIRMQIDPTKLARIYLDAHAELVPRTPLQDMQVNIWPGERSAGALKVGGTIPAGQTIVPVNADEVLRSLDTDTRTWLASLITSLGQATSGRGQDIRNLLRALGPTSAELQQVGNLLAERHQELAQIVHNLGTVAQAGAEENGQLRTLIQTGDLTVNALAGQDVALRRSIEALPGALQQTRTTLGHITTFANALGPTATALEPTARSLPATLKRSQILFKSAILLPLNRIPAFVHAVTPLARKLPGLASNLKIEVPDLINALKVLAYSTNELAFNPGNGNPGFLYWLAWFVHNSDSFSSVSDANGPVWRTLLVSSCASLKSLPVGPILGKVLGTNFRCKKL
jgi:phospholipid/cholesterol/gamma-HCH transport system substrate-binding protein